MTILAQVHSLNRPLHAGYVPYTVRHMFSTVHIRINGGPLRLALASAGFYCTLYLSLSLSALSLSVCFGWVSLFKSHTRNDCTTRIYTYQMDIPTYRAHTHARMALNVWTNSSWGPSWLLAWLWAGLGYSLFPPVVVVVVVKKKLLLDLLGTMCPSPNFGGRLHQYLMSKKGGPDWPGEGKKGDPSLLPSLSPFRLALKGHFNKDFQNMCVVKI